MNLHEYLDSQEEVNNENFTIDDEQKANWALRKIKQHQEQQKENTALAESEINKIEEWLKSENDKAQQSIDYFQGLLASYALNLRESDPKFKSSKLPNGRIRFKKQQPKFNYDEDKLTQHLKQSGYTDLIKVKESPDKTAVKKKFVVQGNRLIDQETGEFVAGVEVEEREDKFEVVTDE